MLKAKNRKTYNGIFYSICILFGIFAYELMKCNIYLLFQTPQFHSNASAFENSWTLSSAIGSIILGFYSDKFVSKSSRKPIMIFGMLISLGTCILLEFTKYYYSNKLLPILPIAIVNGCWGNYISAARAFYLDRYSSNRVLHFTVTVITQCIPWLLLGFLLRKEITQVGLINLISILTTFLAICFILPISFKNEKEEEKESKIDWKNFNNPKYYSIIFSFFIWCVAYHLFPYTGAQVFTDPDVFTQLIVLYSSLIIGAGVCVFFEKKDSLKTLKIMYLSCALYFLIHLISYQIGIRLPEFMRWGQFFMFSGIGGAIWIFSVKDFLTKNNKSTGLLLGIVESLQSLSEFAGSSLSLIIGSMFIQKGRINSSIMLGFLIAIILVLYLGRAVDFFKRNNHKI